MAADLQPQVSGTETVLETRCGPMKYIRLLGARCVKPGAYHHRPVDLGQIIWLKSFGLIVLSRTVYVSSHVVISTVLKSFSQLVQFP